jgi:hypothetical protein
MAEIQATRDVGAFIQKSRAIYGYQNFLCDTSGSLCEIDDPETWKILAEHCLLVYIRSTPQMQQALIERAQKSPKPLYYKKSFLLKAIADYLVIHKLSDSGEIDPADFAIWIFPYLVSHRLALYQNIADQYGITVQATETVNIKTENEFLKFILNSF